MAAQWYFSQQQQRLAWARLGWPSGGRGRLTHDTGRGCTRSFGAAGPGSEHALESRGGAPQLQLKVCDALEDVVCRVQRRGVMFGGLFIGRGARRVGRAGQRGQRGQTSNAGQEKQVQRADPRGFMSRPGERWRGRGGGRGTHCRCCGFGGASPWARVRQAIGSRQNLVSHPMAVAPTCALSPMTSHPAACSMQGQRPQSLPEARPRQLAVQPAARCCSPAGRAPSPTMTPNALLGLCCHALPCCCYCYQAHGTLRMWRPFALTQTAKPTCIEHPSPTAHVRPWRRRDCTTASPPRI